MLYVVVYVEVSCKEFVSQQQLSTEHYNAESGDTNRWSIKRYMLWSYFDLRGNWKLSCPFVRKLTALKSVKRKRTRGAIAILALTDLNNITKRKVGVEWWLVLQTIKFVSRHILSGQRFSVQKIVWPNHEWQTSFYSEGGWGFCNGQSLFVARTKSLA
jgi:hypothetical protein